jgi:uncharacterized protein (DUF983 family)
MSAFDVAHYCPHCGKRLPFNGYVVLVKTRCRDCKNWIVVTSTQALLEEDYLKQK